MNALEPSVDPIEIIAERYEASERFTDDALDYLATFADHHDEAIELAESLYRASSQFATMLEDIADGVVEL